MDIDNRARKGDEQMAVLTRTAPQTISVSIDDAPERVHISTWERDEDGIVTKDVQLTLDRETAVRLAMRLLRAADVDRDSWYIES